MSILTCPNCQAILEPLDKSMKCEKGHSFDISKEGYINLLLPNQKKKLNPGDNKLMLNAREAFLSSGHYDFLLELIDKSIQPLNLFKAPHQDSINLLDLGCGTGYYTRNLFKDNNINRVGIDISKIGTAIAAKKDKQSTYIVGSAFDLPIVNHTIDIVANIFSPIQLSEMSRVLKPGGYLVKVIPVGDHMKEIATMAYDHFIPHQSAILSELESNNTFEVITTETLKKKVSLMAINLQNLISMTPYIYKFKEEQLDKLEEQSVTLSFQVIIAKYG